MAKSTGLSMSMSANTDPKWAEVLKNAKWTFDPLPIQGTASGGNWPYWNGNGTAPTTQPYTAPNGTVPPLPVGFPRPPDPYPLDPEYEITILRPTEDVPFRQIRVEITGTGHFGVLWFDGESMADALERLAAEVRGFIPF